MSRWPREQIVWAVLTMLDLGADVTYLAWVVDRGVHDRLGLWEPPALTALGLTFLFVVGCYAVRVTGSSMRGRGDTGASGPPG